MIRLNHTYYSLLNFTSKLFFKLGPSGKNSSKLHKFRTIRPHSPQILQNSHYSFTYYTLCIRHMPQQRALRNSSELRKIPRNSPTKSANYAKFTPFVNISYVSDTCPSREPSAIPVNYANSMQFAHTVRKSREIRTIC